MNFDYIKVNKPIHRKKPNKYKNGLYGPGPGGGPLTGGQCYVYYVYYGPPNMDHPFVTSGSTEFSLQ